MEPSRAERARQHLRAVLAATHAADDSDAEAVCASKHNHDALCLPRAGVVIWRINPKHDRMMHWGNRAKLPPWFIFSSRATSLPCRRGDLLVLMPSGGKQVPGGMYAAYMATCDATKTSLSIEGVSNYAAPAQPFRASHQWRVGARYMAPLHLTQEQSHGDAFRGCSSPTPWRHAPSVWDCAEPLRSALLEALGC